MKNKIVVTMRDNDITSPSEIVDYVTIIVNGDKYRISEEDGKLRILSLYGQLKVSWSGAVNTAFLEQTE